MSTQSSEEQSISPNAEGVSAGNAGLDEPLQTPPGSDERLIERLAIHAGIVRQGSYRTAAGVMCEALDRLRSLLADKAHAAELLQAYVAQCNAEWKTERDARLAAEVLLASVSEGSRQLQDLLHQSQARASKAEARLEWRPIESAPKDGGRVLLGLSGDQYLVVGWWVSDAIGWERWLDKRLPDRWMPCPPPSEPEDR